MDLLEIIRNITSHALSLKAALPHGPATYLSIANDTRWALNVAACTYSYYSCVRTYKEDMTEKVSIIVYKGRCWCWFCMAINFEDNNFIGLPFPKISQGYATGNVTLTFCFPWRLERSNWCWNGKRQSIISTSRSRVGQEMFKFKSHGRLAQ